MKNSILTFKPSVLFSTMILSILLISSCDKESLLSSNPTFSDFLQIIIDESACLDADINGTLWIQSYRTVHTQNIERADIQGYFNGSQGAEDKGDLIIGNNITITPDDQNRYASTDNLSFLYGATTSIELKDDQSTYFNTDFTLPELVKFTYPTPADDFVIEAQSSIVTWESDIDNSVGVAISLNYSPSFPSNEIFVSQGYDQIVENVKLIDDNGSYQLLASDFEGIPDGAIITVRMVRVGCDTVIDDETGGKYFIYGYSMVDAAGMYMGGLQ